MMQIEIPATRNETTVGGPEQQVATERKESVRA